MRLLLQSLGELCRLRLPAVGIEGFNEAPAAKLGGTMAHQIEAAKVADASMRPPLQSLGEHGGGVTGDAPEKRLQ